MHVGRYEMKAVLFLDCAALWTILHVRECYVRSELVERCRFCGNCDVCWILHSCVTLCRRKSAVNNLNRLLHISKHPIVDYTHTHTHTHTCLLYTSDAADDC